MITLEQMQEYNIRSKLRERLLNSDPNVSDDKNLLDIKYIRDIVAIQTRNVETGDLGVPRTAEFVDMSLGEPSYNSADFPRIHVAFGNESGSKVTVDTTTRLRDFTFAVAIYINSYIKDDALISYNSTDKNMLLSRLEDLAAWLDYKLVTNYFGDKEGVTVFDLDGTEYAIQDDTSNVSGDSKSSIYGVVTLTYRINYYLRYV